MAPSLGETSDVAQGPLAEPPPREVVARTQPSSLAEAPGLDQGLVLIEDSGEEDGASSATAAGPAAKPCGTRTSRPSSR